MKAILDKSFLINKKKVFSREVEGEVVFLDKGKRTLHELNKTASFIWSRADGKTTLREIIEEVAERYEMDKSKVERDVTEFVQNAANKKYFIL